MAFKGIQQDQHRLRRPDGHHGSVKSQPIGPGTIRDARRLVRADRYARAMVRNWHESHDFLGRCSCCSPISNCRFEPRDGAEQRDARFHRASFDLGSLPQVRVPYRMWRSPALISLSAPVRIGRRTASGATGRARSMPLERLHAFLTMPRSRQICRKPSLEGQGLPVGSGRAIVGALKATHRFWRC